MNKFEESSDVKHGWGGVSGDTMQFIKGGESD